jgi:hypothetical protein
MVTLSSVQLLTLKANSGIPTHLAIRCPTPHWLVVVVAEDQDEPEEEVAEDQTDNDVKRT